jgi:hypothetical protein
MMRLSCGRTALLLRAHLQRETDETLHVLRDDAGDMHVHRLRYHQKSRPNGPAQLSSIHDGIV